MVEDSKIKTKTSPFAIREGEIKKFDGKDGYVSINQIIQKINIGHITDIHFKILELVNDFEFITSRQIYQMLEKKGEQLQSQDKLNNKLDQLVKNKIITRYYFQSEDSKGIYRIYSLEKMGKYLLNSRSIECKWQPTDNTKPVAMIKKRLAANQIIIAYFKKVKAFDAYTIKPKLNAKQNNKMFKPSVDIKLTKKNISINLIFEVIRREEEMIKKVIEKMKLYQDFYTNFIKFDSGYELKPQLILVCEDEKHILEIFKIIIENKLEILEIKVYFSTELRQNEETLSKSLSEFVKNESTGKYKIKTVDIKVLE